MRKGGNDKSLLGIIVAVIAVVLLVTGGFIQSLSFLLWVGVVLAVIAAIVLLVRYLGSGRTTP